MIQKKAAKMKKGAASFYMVAFSTLILIIIVTSFAAVIISEVTRTANDDLSQSAYDSALAGVEDAKLVIYQYQKCKKMNDLSPLCTEIIDKIENSSSGSDESARCDAVGKILQRIDKEEGGEVVVQESNVSNNMSQAYTCVNISLPGDYRASTSSTKVIKTRFEDGVANNVTKVKVSWYTAPEDDLGYNYSNYSKSSGVAFPTDIATPPTIFVSMVQTAKMFDLESFKSTDSETTNRGTTNRGTVFLVPAKEKPEKPVNDDANYLVAENDEKGGNYIDKNGFLNSNRQQATNKPYVVYCPDNNNGNEFACSATIEIPRPIGGGERNSETFDFVVSVPYGSRDSRETDFKLDFFCDENEEGCGSKKINPDASPEEKSVAKLDGVQIKIDSTGRANDMFRRVEVRLEGESNYPLSIMGPLELLKDVPLEKDMGVTSEWSWDSYGR